MRTLVDELQPAGTRQARFDGRDAEGRDLPAGVYFYRITAAGRHESAKLTIVR